MMYMYKNTDANSSTVKPPTATYQAYKKILESTRRVIRILMHASHVPTISSTARMCLTYKWQGICFDPIANNVVHDLIYDCNLIIIIIITFTSNGFGTIVIGPQTYS